MIPLLHDFDGETVLVFGGGPVGARKARRFATAAAVVVVSPEFAAEGFGGAERVRAAPGPEAVGEWLDRFDPALVVAATDDGDLNARVEADARERGLLVNRTDTHETSGPGSVAVPATVEDGDVLVAVSTGSPALSKHLRERFEDDIAGVGALASATRDLRADMQDRGVPPDERRAAVRAIVESRRVWKVLGAGESKVRRTVEEVASDVLKDQP